MTTLTDCTESLSLSYRDLIAAARDASSLLRLPAERLDLTLRLLRRTRLLGRVAHQLQSTGALETMPTIVRDQLSSALAVAESRERIARWELDRIAVALEHDAAVPVVVLKGCAYLLAGTPNANGRLFADVDLLVPEESLLAIESRLRSEGWASKELTAYDDQYYRRWTHELPAMSHPARDVELDLHHNLLMRTARLKPSAELLLAGAREVADSRYKVLAPVDMSLHAMVHLFYGGEMDDALRELVDIDQLLGHFAVVEPDFWCQFWSRAKVLDLARPAFYGLRYSAGFLGTPVPDRVMQAAQAGAPSPLVLRAMDGIVQRTLFPQPTHGSDLASSLARGAAYARSHWVKMPPAMLVRHLATKSVARLREQRNVAD